MKRLASRSAVLLLAAADDDEDVDGGSLVVASFRFILSQYSLHICDLSPRHCVPVSCGDLSRNPRDLKFLWYYFVGQLVVFV